MIKIAQHAKSNARNLLLTVPVGMDLTGYGVWRAGGVMFCIISKILTQYCTPWSLPKSSQPLKTIWELYPQAHQMLISLTSPILSYISNTE